VKEHQVQRDRDTREPHDGQESAKLLMIHARALQG
jgi:hypothetical protein